MTDRFDDRYYVSVASGPGMFFLLEDNDVFRALAIDVSQRGLLVRASHKLNLYSKIKLLAAGEEIELEVLWCRPEDFTFKAGLRTKNPDINLVVSLQKLGILLRSKDSGNIPSQLSGCDVPRSKLADLGFVS